MRCKIKWAKGEGFDSNADPVLDSWSGLVSAKATHWGVNDTVTRSPWTVAHWWESSTPTRRLVYRSASLWCSRSLSSVNRGFAKQEFWEYNMDESLIILVSTLMSIHAQPELVEIYHFVLSRISLSLHISLTRVKPRKAATNFAWI